MRVLFLEQRESDLLVPLRVLAATLDRLRAARIAIVLYSAVWVLLADVPFVGQIPLATPNETRYGQYAPGRTPTCASNTHTALRMTTMSVPISWGCCRADMVLLWLVDVRVREREKSEGHVNVQSARAAGCRPQIAQPCPNQAWLDRTCRVRQWAAVIMHLSVVYNSGRYMLVQPQKLSR